MKHVYLFIASILSFSFLAIAQPANDDCTNATALTIGTACNSITGDVNAATASGVATCISGANANDDVWYKFVATSGSINIEATPSQGFNMTLEMYSSCGGNSIYCSHNAILIGGSEKIEAKNLVIGNTYYVRVYDFGGSYPTNTQFSICAYAPFAGVPPTNDSCAKAELVMVDTACTDPLISTIEYATPTTTIGSCSDNTGGDVWYKFVATAANITVEALGGDGFDMILELYDNCGGASLKCVDDFGQADKEMMSLTNLSIGQTYYVRVLNFRAMTPTDPSFLLCIYTSPPAPVNDDCANSIVYTATLIGCSPVIGDVSGATESLPACSGDANDDVWYSFNAPSSNFFIDATPLGSDFNVVFELYKNSCTGVGDPICVDKKGLAQMEQLLVDSAIVNETYYLRIYHYGANVPSNTKFNLCVYGAAPSNDDCSGAQLLTSGTTCNKTTANTANATQSIDSDCSGGDANDDVWFKFVATAANTTVQVDAGFDFDAVIEVYNSCSDQNSFTCIDDNFEQEVLSLDGLTIGNTYFIRVYDYAAGYATDATFDICVYETPAPPANDECATSIAVTVVNTPQQCSNYSATTIGATESAEDASCSSLSIDDDVWYNFIATDSVITFKAFNLSGIDGIGLTAYANSCAGVQVSECTFDAAGDSLIFRQLTIGEKYYLRLFSAFAPEVGSFDFCLYKTPKVPAGINAIAINSSVTVFPNPASGIINIKSNETILGYEIVNVLGQTVLANSLVNNQIDIQILNKGLYQIILRTNNGRIAKSFVVE